MAVSPRPSVAPVTIPADSASPELKAMVFRVMDQHFLVCCPRRHTPPHVDRRVRKQPAKSVPT
eukprot:1493814-Alexandrium_andersonii.AAC.1